MKKFLLVLTITLLSFINSRAQSISVTSINSDPVEVNNSFTLNIEYTTTNPNDIIYSALELKNSDGSWAATIAESIINPVGTSGTDVVTSTVISIPDTATPSTDLTGGQFYQVKVELNAEAWAGWLAGAYPTITVAPEGTLSLSVDKNELNQLTVYPNPALNTLSLSGLENNLQNIKILNLLGEIVYNNSSSLKNKEIDVSNLTSGMYVLYVKHDNKLSNVKFIKR